MSCFTNIDDASRGEIYNLREKTMEEKHSNFIEKIKKVGVVTLAVFSFAFCPFITIIGFATSLAFNKEFDMLGNKIKQFYNELDSTDKKIAIVGTVCLAFVMPGIITHFAIGAYCGNKVFHMLKDQQ